MSKKWAPCVMAALVTIALLGASCSGPSGPNVVGKWEKASGDLPSTIEGTVAAFPLLAINGMEFLRDGTFILDYMNTSGKYSFPDDKHIKLESPGGTLTFGIFISGDTILLTTAGGAQFHYSRAGTRAPVTPSRPTATPNQSTIQKLLALLPASVMQDDPASLYINDYAKMRQIYDIAPPASSTENDLSDYWGQFNMETGPIMNPGSFYSGTSTYSRSAGLINPHNVGYGLEDIDAFVYTGTPPALVEVMSGSFSPSATRQALQRQDTWPKSTTGLFSSEVYNGVSLYSWGDGNILRMEDRLKPPIIDNLGRLRPIAVTDKNVFVSDSVANVKSMIDLSSGRASGLLGLRQYADIAQGLTDMNVYSAAIVRTVSQGWFASKDTSGSPLLGRYLAYGTGVGKDDNGAYSTIVIAYSDPKTAADNVKILQTRIENVSVLVVDDPKTAGYTVKWSDRVTDFQVYSKGNLVVAKFLGSRGLWKPSAVLDVLLLHE